MKKKPVRSMTAVCLIVVFSLLLSWIFCMACLTVIQANEVYDGLLDYYGSLTYSFYLDSTVWDQPEYQTYRSLDCIHYTFNRSGHLHRAGPFHWDGSSDELLNITVPVQAAVTVTGDTWSLESGDYLYFSYAAQQQWEQGAKEQAQSGYVRLYRDQGDPFAKLYQLYQGDSSWHFQVRNMRITGYVHGEQIEPVQIDYISEQAYWEALEQTAQYYTDEDGNTWRQEPDENMPISQLDSDGLLRWETLMQVPASTEEPVQVIYAEYPEMTVYEGAPVTYRGQQYANMLELIRQVEPSDDAGEYSLEQLILFDRMGVTDANGERVSVVTGFYAQPLKATIQGLFPVYLYTGLFVLLMGGISISFLRHKLLLPVKQCVLCIEDDWNSHLLEKARPWREPAQLQQLLDIEADHRRKAQDTITRLQTALSYAKTAEQNRRQLTSNIAHELKTPLAIIHSYAEGLQEQIAEDKREQYLDTILTEAQRMDAMVMELLDLSRLEAGKVTLTRTGFALDQAVRACWEPFAPLAEKKQLQVRFQLEKDCRITADEARITQVLRNFLSNAVNYTPENGQVIIRVQAGRKTVSFCVENTAPHFSQEDLQKIWDSFYRTDKARTGKGTGLGLAIAKSIITLHGGSCQVKNTEIGVEFGFRL